MEILLLVLTVGLPILKLVLFPARTMRRGGNWTIIGALMIVGLMMVIWFGVQSVSDTAGALTPAAAAKPGDATTDPDLSALEKLLS